MGARSLLFLIILATFWYCDDATRMVGSTISLSSVPEKWEMIKDEIASDEGWCTFCKLVIAPILDSLSNDTSQEQTLALFHLICQMTIIAKPECNALVDHYIPLFFNETSRKTPQNICTKIGLCCNQTDHHHILGVSDQFLQQMQIVHGKLLEACNSLGNSDHVTDSCKRIVLNNAVFIQRRFSKRNT